MKFANTFSAVMLLAGASVTAQVASFTNVVNTAIPDANPTGLSSTIDVSGVAGLIGDLNVYLDISGGWNGDLYAYLSFDNGGFAVLLNRVGKSGSNPTGYGDAGINAVLDDDAAAIGVGQRFAHSHVEFVQQSQRKRNLDVVPGGHGCRIRQRPCEMGTGISKYPGTEPGGNRYCGHNRVGHGVTVAPAPPLKAFGAVEGVPTDESANPIRLRATPRS
ncbi:MAG: hypothetical protein DME26_22460 [Verrucomicrobia bacterium]|nr:MAG: hypothetical protein DME26_22460 [Verrucomicrobiota bacterium]